MSYRVIGVPECGGAYGWVNAV